MNIMRCQCAPCTLPAECATTHFMAPCPTAARRQGVAIWGGPNWERVNRFAHQGVCLLEFSPNEKFLITYSSQVGGSQQV